jgi:uncharacterized protein (DUF433 family)
MTTRRIVRDKSIMGGRWHFEGTHVPVAAIRADALAGVDALMRTYRHVGLTEADILLALDFDFPDVRETELVAQYAAVTVMCQCGEETHATISGFDRAEVRCACGRDWCVRLALDPADHPVR